MGRITGTSTNLVDQQQSHEFQAESNPHNEVLYHQNQQQQTPFSPSNAHTTVLSPADEQATYFSPVNQQPATSFSPGNAQPATAFSPANGQPATAFSPANAQPTPAFSPGNAQSATAFNSRPTGAFHHPHNNAQQHGHYYQAPQAPPMQYPPCNNQHYSAAPAQPQETRPEVGIPVPVRNDQLWSTGLFDCLDDPCNALVTMFLPCLTYGQIAHILDHGQSPFLAHVAMYICILHFTGFTCLLTWPARTKMRKQYGLVASPAPDCIVHLCCETCALCQEYREIHIRGIDPSLGWDENVNRRHVTMMPPMTQRMM